MNHYFCKTIPCVYAYASTNPIYKICKEWYFIFCIEKKRKYSPSCSTFNYQNTKRFSGIEIE